MFLERPNINKANDPWTNLSVKALKNIVRNKTVTFLTVKNTVNTTEVEISGTENVLGRYVL